MHRASGWAHCPSIWMVSRSFPTSLHSFPKTNPAHAKD
jgi:hypothetical protein